MNMVNIWKPTDTAGKKIVLRILPPLKDRQDNVLSPYSFTKKHYYTTTSAKALSDHYKLHCGCPGCRQAKNLLKPSKYNDLDSTWKV